MSQEFYRAIVELAGDITKRTKEFNQALERERRDAVNTARLRDDGGQLIYLHSRARDKARWEAAREELIRAGYGVYPMMGPEAEYNDPQEALDTREDNIRTLSRCDALLLVPGDPRSLQEDYVEVGHGWRNLARAQSNKLLPCAVIDRGLMLDALWRQNLKNLRIYWIDAAITGWIDKIRGWLSDAAGAGQIAA
jgi:hypothetical protein